MWCLPYHRRLLAVAASLTNIIHFFSPATHQRHFVSGGLSTRRVFVESREAETMSFQWTFLATFLYCELVVVFILLLPFISPTA